MALAPKAENLRGFSHPLPYYHCRLWGAGVGVGGGGRRGARDSPLTRRSQWVQTFGMVSSHSGSRWTLKVQGEVNHHSPMVNTQTRVFTAAGRRRKHAKTPPPAAAPYVSWREETACSWRKGAETRAFVGAETPA